MSKGAKSFDFNYSVEKNDFSYSVERNEEKTEFMKTLHNNSYSYSNSNRRIISHSQASGSNNNVLRIIYIYIYIYINLQKNQIIQVNITTILYDITISLYYNTQRMKVKMYFKLAEPSAMKMILQSKARGILTRNFKIYLGQSVDTHVHTYIHTYIHIILFHIFLCFVCCCMALTILSI